ncbi:probable serine/threonine-protein kinase samkC [Drosophila mojavensis]|uniref:Lethal hybrid rescue protein n=1 Tax=Drosophila mojavensis TaxID=7230 RepID=A0PKA4_DROMO|nr:probable serine/threonine-protein kinase samkC [Drosophila mojavensis]EDW10352.1 uncharacterized protein Dmoj_GI18576 [Drosophila mojavensis]DAA05822.1 TPA_inf: lethal hybrid rescue protein [Drosophila mojavensis]
MDNDDSEDAPEMEINTENINAKSEIILNDLRLLELIYMHPYLISNALNPHNDNDYEEWGWEQITNAFNCSYEGLNLNTPFCIEKLRWRWDILRPMCHSFKDKHSQLPTQLRSIMREINQLMNAAPQMKFREDIPTQSFILDQIPFIEQLPLSLQRPLEVEILNAIFIEERSEGISLGAKETKLAQSEYEHFFKAIRVKELPKNAISRKSSIHNSTGTNPDSSKATASKANTHESELVFTKVHSMPNTEKPRPEPLPMQPEPVPMQPEPVPMQPEPVPMQPEPVPMQPEPVPMQPAPVTKKPESQHQQPEPKNPQPEPQHSKPQTEHPKPKPIQLFTQPLIIKEEPPDLFQVEQQELKRKLRDTHAQLQMRYVPLDSVRLYVKKVRVRVKRLDLADYVRQSNRRQLRKCRVKMYK